MIKYRLFLLKGAKIHKNTEFWLENQKNKDLLLVKNYYVVRKAESAYSRNTWELTLIFVNKLRNEWNNNWFKVSLKHFLGHSSMCITYLIFTKKWSNKKLHWQEYWNQQVYMCVKFSKKRNNSKILFVQKITSYFVFQIVYITVKFAIGDSIRTVKNIPNWASVKFIFVHKIWIRLTQPSLQIKSSSSLLYSKQNEIMDL